MKKPRSSHRFLLIIIILLSSCLQQSTNIQDEPTQQHSTVALYSDKGTWEDSVEALQNMFQWMGYSVTLVDAQYINNEDLDDFSILCIPGGDMYQYAQKISSKGKKTIRNFIDNGGGYIGVCGGAYFASKKVVWRGNQLSMITLELFPGTAEGPFNEIVVYPDYAMCEIDMATTHPVTQSGAPVEWMLYYWGPMLIVDDIDADIAILGRYTAGNQPAIVAFDYGKGRVFLIGTHPEIEEDSSRDGVEFADELDDNGSDWDLMKRAVLWCLKELNQK